jgi:hypothetical protein
VRTALNQARSKIENDNDDEDEHDSREA